MSRGLRREALRRREKMKLRSIIKNQDGVIKSIKSQIGSLVEDKQLCIEKYESIETDLEIRYHTLRKQFLDLQENRVFLQSRLDKLMYQSGVKAGHIVQLKQTASNSVQAGKTLNLSLQAIKKELRKLKTQQAQHVARIDKIKKDLSSTSGQLNELQNKYSNLETAHVATLQQKENNFRAKMETQSRQQQRLQEQLRERVTQNADLIKREKMIGGDIPRLVSDCCAKTKQQKTLKYQMLEYKENMQAIQCEQDKNKAQLKAKDQELANALARFTANNDSRQVHVDQMVAASNLLQNNIRDQQREAERLESELDSLKESITKSSTKLANTQSRLSKSEQLFSEQRTQEAALYRSLEHGKQIRADTITKIAETKAAFERATVQWKQESESGKQAWGVAKNRLEEMLCARSTELQSAKTAVREVQQKLKVSEDKNVGARSLVREQEIILDTMKNNMGVSSETQSLRMSMMKTERVMLTTRRRTLCELENSYDDLQGKAREMEQQLLESEMLRRKLHNRIQELRGNSRVFVRVRPFLPSDPVDVFTDCVVNLSQANSWSDECLKPIQIGVSKQLIKVVSEGHIPIQKFRVDRIFGMKSKQSQVFEEATELVQSAIDGQNVCILCYGQTGSGKSYTMQGVGSGEEQGLIPRSIKQIVATASKLRTQGWEVDVDASYLEVYNNNINDLLRSFDGAACPEHAETNRAGYDVKKTLEGDTYVSNLKCFRINEMHEVERLIAHMTEKQSVRSAAIKSRDTKEVHGALHLCDLAGSEHLSRSEARGSTLTKIKGMNRSLEVLADVFTQVKAKSNHICFRNSKLTHLLEPCFDDKNGKTMVLVNLSPTLESTQETLSSLKFANKVHQEEPEAQPRVSGTPQKTSAKVRTPSSRLYKTPTSQARRTPKLHKTPKGVSGTPRSSKRRAHKTPLASSGDSSKRMKR